MAKTKTHEQYVSEVFKINTNIEVLDNYIDAKTKILHRCTIHNYQWYAKPNNILNGKGCRICANIKISNSRKKTNEKYIQELYTLYPTINVLEEYQGDATKILHECVICKNKWNVAPGMFLQNKGCPVCAGHIIGGAPKYINSIWASEYKDFFSIFMTEKQMKCTMPHSSKKISISCPDCGFIKYISPANLVNSGFSCICNDGQSFPNKFVYNVLSQLNVKVIPEYSPEWAGRRRYDDFLIDYNVIVENHGKQHYEENIFGTKSLCEERENDMLKYNLAQCNGVKSYIVIDCRYPNVEWIKKSIMQSDLPNILNFSEDDIDWTEALKYATHSLVKTTADMFNNNISIVDIASKLQKHQGTIRRWLKCATKIGWCDYIPRRPKEVYCIETHTLFNTKSDGARSANTSIASIINNLNGVYAYAGRHPQTNVKLHWLSKEDAIKQRYI